MHADIVWWDLSGSGESIESLREYLRKESVSAFAEVPGLRLKVWISDHQASRATFQTRWFRGVAGLAYVV